MRRAIAWLEHHGIVFVLIGLSGLGLLGVELHSQAVSQGTLRDASLRGCSRLNVERARNNRDWKHVYEADLASLAYDQTFKALVIAGLKHQTNQVRRTPAQEHATKLFVRRLSGDIKGIEENIAGVEWVPFTSCYPAVDDPLGYRAPEPHPFAVLRYGKHGQLLGMKTTLPPQSALVVGPGE